MADHKHDNRNEHQQHEGGGDSIYNHGVHLQLPYYKRVIEMAQVKWALIICDMLGISATLMGIFANLENVKSTVLFFLALIFLMLRLYFFVVQRRQAIREKDLELWHMEQDKEERINSKK